MNDPTSDFVDAQTVETSIGRRIHGQAYAAIEKGDFGYFDMPLISHIEGGLWMGGCPEGWCLFSKKPEEIKFHYVLNLYPWGDYPKPKETKWLVEPVRMHDSDDQPLDKVDEFAKLAVEKLEEGKRVLIHCQAGLNRSGVVSARVLMLWKGMSADEAIALLREKRDKYVLCNQKFEDWLRAFDHPEVPTTHNTYE